VFGARVALLLLAVTAGELLLRVPAVIERLLLPSVGSGSDLLDFKVEYLERFARLHGDVDCLFLGPSTVNRGIDPTLVSDAFQVHRPVLPAAQRPWWQPLGGWALTVSTLLIALPLFLAPLPGGLATWQVLLSPAAWAVPIQPEWRVALLILPSLWLDWVALRGRDELALLRSPEPARVALTACALLAVFLFTRMSVPEPFVYQGF
jgi:hypothetical protein